MFSMARHIFGNIVVTENMHTIVIDGLPANGITKEITDYWKTSKIGQYMFVKYSSYKISFPKFFAIEMLYMFEELRDTHIKYRRVPKSLYGKIISELRTKTWLKDIHDNHEPILDRSKQSLFFKKPLNHQTDFFDLYDKNIPKYNLKGYVLALDTGAGKTLTSLMTSEQLGADHIFTICPTRALFNVWRKAYETEYKVPVDNWTSRDNAPYPSKNPPKGIICHYEYLEKISEDIIKLTKQGKKVALIIDESHSFNEVTAQRTQILLDMCKRSKFITVLWLSATPIKALGSEMIPMLTTFDNFMTDDVTFRFRKIFGKNTVKGIDIVKNRMGLVSYVVKIEKSRPEFYSVPVTIPDPKPFLLDTIRDDMVKFITERMDHYKKNFKVYEKTYNDGVAIYAKTVRSDEARAELETYKKNITIISGGYDPSSMVEIAKFCNDFEDKKIYPTLPTKFNKEWRSSKSVIKYVDLKVRGECLGTIVGKRRAQSVVAMIPHIGIEEIVNNSVKKVVIFSSYIEGVTATVDYLKSKGIDSLFVYGINTNNVSDIVNEFGRNDKYKVLVTTYQSLSSAMPLTMASTIITLNVPFRDHDYQQAIGRIDRIDQDTQTEIYNAVLDTGAKANISSRTFDIMQWSKEMVESIMGKSSDHLVEITYESLYKYGLSDVKGIDLSRLGKFEEVYIDKIDKKEHKLFNW